MSTRFRRNVVDVSSEVRSNFVRTNYNNHWSPNVNIKCFNSPFKSNQIIGTKVTVEVETGTRNRNTKQEVETGSRNKNTKWRRRSIATAPKAVKSRRRSDAKREIASPERRKPGNRIARAPKTEQSRRRSTEQLEIASQERRKFEKSIWRIIFTKICLG